MPGGNVRISLLQIIKTSQRAVDSPGTDFLDLQCKFTCLRQNLREGRYSGLRGKMVVLIPSVAWIPPLFLNEFWRKI